MLTVGRLIDDINECGWVESPGRKLVFARGVPRPPRALPRYLPPDADRRLSAALHASPNRLRADALLLLRATWMRIGELCDLELDCVHEVPGSSRCRSTGRARSGRFCRLFNTPWMWPMERQPWTKRLPLRFQLWQPKGS